MKTRIKQTGDTTIIAMDGKLNHEIQEPLRRELQKLAQQNLKTDSVAKIIFDFENLEFVGSSGISSFVQTLKEFSHRLPNKPRYCHVRSEFQKFMKALDENDLFEFYETEERAKNAFDQ